MNVNSHARELRKSNKLTHARVARFCLDEYELMSAKPVLFSEREPSQGVAGSTSAYKRPAKIKFRPEGRWLQTGNSKLSPSKMPVAESQDFNPIILGTAAMIRLTKE